MAEKADAPAEGALVKESYYHDGARWERDIYRRLELSRNAWRLVAIGSLACLGIGLVGLALLIPLKSTEVVTLVVDKATGFTQANIVRYIRARETYDPPALRDNFELAALLSAGQASKDLQDEYSASDPQNPMRLYGANGRIRVTVESVNFLTDGWMNNPKSPATAAVRFITIRTNERERVEEHWAGNVRFRYSGEPMKNEWRWDNPLGFQVIEYRRDQETVAPIVGAGMATPADGSGGAPASGEAH